MSDKQNENNNVVEDEVTNFLNSLDNTPASTPTELPAEPIATPKAQTKTIQEKDANKLTQSIQNLKLENENENSQHSEPKQQSQTLKNSNDADLEKNANASSTSNSWSFTSLWSSASNVLKETQNSELLKKNVSSVKNTLSGLSQTVMNNEATRNLETSIKTFANQDTLTKLTKDISKFTQSSVNNVINTLAPPPENLEQLQIVITSDYDYAELEHLVYKNCDELLNRQNYFKDLIIKNGKVLQVKQAASQGHDEEEEEGLVEEEAEISPFQKISHGFVEGYNVAKLRVEAAASLAQNQASTTSTAASYLATSCNTTSVFIAIHPCKAAPLPDTSLMFHSCVLFSPADHHYIKTFSQAHPVGDTEAYDILNILALSVRQIITEYLTFKIDQLNKEYLKEYKN